MKKTLKKSLIALIICLHGVAFYIGLTADFKFNPEGSNYDYVTAAIYRMKRDIKGHMGSLAPLSKTKGLVLKGREHPTWNLMVEEEKRRGNKVIKIGGRYYSVPMNYF